jgi:hypothetical protein
VELGQLLHPANHKISEGIQDICEQNELLRVENRRSDIIEELGALDCNSNASNFVVLVPELIQLFIQSLQLVRELLRRDHLHRLALSWFVSF